MSYSKEQRKQYQKAYREKQRNTYIDMLGGQCVTCGSVEELDFDHIDPDTKKFTISGFNKPKAEILEELKKCQLLCQECHKKKTTSEQSKPRTRHGTTTMYQKYKCRCPKCKEAYDNWYDSYRERRSLLRRISGVERAGKRARL